MPVDVFEADLPIFDAAAGLGVPIYIHSGPQLQQLRDIAYSGFDRWTSMILGTGGWRWHTEAGPPTLTRILAGTFDRHPDLQIILGHWGEMLVAFADRADLLRGVATRPRTPAGRSAELAEIIALEKPRSRPPRPARARPPRRPR